MGTFREKLGKGLVLAALAAFLTVPAGCIGGDPVAYTPGDSTDNEGDPGATDVRGDLDVQLQRPVGERDGDGAVEDGGR